MTLEFHDTFYSITLFTIFVFISFPFIIFSFIFGSWCIFLSTPSTVIIWVNFVGTGSPSQQLRFLLTWIFPTPIIFTHIPFQSHFHTFDLDHVFIRKCSFSEMLTTCSCITNSYPSSSFYHYSTALPGSIISCSLYLHMVPLSSLSSLSVLQHLCPFPAIAPTLASFSFPESTRKTKV